MHRLSSTTRPLLTFMASAPPYWSPAALALRLLPLKVAHIPDVRHVSGFPRGYRNIASTRRGAKGKPNRGLPISSTKNHSAISQGMKKVEARGTTLEVRRSATKERKWAVVLSNDEEDVSPVEILPKSTHRDGSLYNTSTHVWKRNYQVADRSETRVEPMMLSNPTNCTIRNGRCTQHVPRHMLQCFSIKLAKLFVDSGTVELYGYIAVRDGLDPLLNYVVNLSRDDPIIVEQGSLIKMSGPKRGIDMYNIILIEYDMRIKTGEKEDDDLQLIDGISVIEDMGGLWNCAFTTRIAGDHGEIDFTSSRVRRAVEATVEVTISQVQSSFDLCLRCFIGGFDEEIRLFDGAIGESRGLKRSVIALVEGSTMDLKFRIGAESSAGSAEHGCSFKADTHGHATRGIKTGFGLISVKVTWSTLIHGF
ncbi:uncharacterized protein [Lolium perenne]|uniref:uncharacterized protein n=1 Tax=Lolium perenne TaxID=4522 RepID=UPI0021F62D68|nr:uncharacterized protein LOC127314206 [Lolium perenne]